MRKRIMKNPKGGWSMPQEIALFYEHSIEKIVKVDQKKEKLEILCCNQSKCLYNAKDLQLTPQNISALNGVRIILTQKNTDEVDACKKHLEEKKQTQQNEIILSMKSMNQRIEELAQQLKAMKGNKK